MDQGTNDRAGTDIGPFSIVPDWIIRAPISDRAQRLYALIGRYADRAGEAFPSRKALAAVLRTSADSVDRATKELVEIGALEVLPRFDRSGDRTSNLYRVILAQPARVAAAPRPPDGTRAATGPRTHAATVAAPVRHGTITSGTKTTLNEKEHDQEQRRSAATHSGQKPENFRTLVRVCHDVLDEVERGVLSALDSTEEIKRRAARADLDYRKTHSAERSAEWQRKHRRKAR